MNDDRLLQEVRRLPREIQPPADLWPGIAARIRRRPGRIVALPAWGLIAASVALVAVSSGVTAYLLREPDRALPVAGALPAHLVELERHYATAANEITRVLERQRDALTPEAIATIGRSLRIIDQALDEARQALRRNPESAALQHLLWAAYQQKLDLLQRAVRLSEEL